MHLVCTNAINAQMLIDLAQTLQGHAPLSFNQLRSKMESVRPSLKTIYEEASYEASSRVPKIVLQE